MLRIRVGIVNDWMTQDNMTMEEEAEYIFEELKETFLGADLELAASGMGVHKVTERRLDLLVIDYGGVLPGTDTPVHQIRAALHWGQEHPSGLVYLYTRHTRRIYEFELQEEFGELDNVEYRYDEDPRGEEVRKRVRMWFGLTDADVVQEPVSELKVPKGREE